MGVGASRIDSDPCTCKTLSFPHFIHHRSCDTGGVGMRVVVPGLPVTLEHARLYPFLISFIIGAVIQVSWG